jgi:hypothetical protein
MNKADQWVNIAIWACILVHVVVLIVGLTSNRLSFLSSWINLIIAFSILLYWVQKQLRIEYHIFEIREWIVLGMEVVVAATSLYLIITKQWAGGVRILTYIFFGLHLLVLILMAIFALTFKMNRLF